jgi:hypothetical protein
MILQHSATRRGAGVGGLPHAAVPAVVPKRSKAVESAASEAASSSTRGSGWAPSVLASSCECRAAQSRQARPEHGSRAVIGGTLTMLSCSQLQPSMRSDARGCHAAQRSAPLHSATQLR